MLRTQKVKRELLSDSVDTKLTRYQFIHDQMSTLTVFNNPPVSYVTMQNQITDFKNKAQAAQTKMIGTGEALRASEAIIDKTMKQLADYIDSIASGNAALIESTGFDATKGETSPSQLPGDIELFTVHIPSTPGVIELNIHKMNGGIAVTYFIGKDLTGLSLQGNHVVIPPQSEPVIIVSDTHSKTTLQGLNSGDTLNAVCFTTNRMGLSKLSHVVGFKVY